LSRAAATADPRPLSLPDALPISGIDPDHTHRLFLSLPALAREPSTKPEHPPAVAHAGARAPSSLRHRPGRAGRNPSRGRRPPPRSEEHTSELQSRENLVCRLLLE